MLDNTITIQHCFKTLENAIRQENEILCINWKRLKTQFIFTDDITVYLRNPRDPNETLLEFSKTYSRMAECIINERKVESIINVLDNKYY